MQMELYNNTCITVDGKLDEPAWANAREITGLKTLLGKGGQPEKAKTTIKILPCADRVYFGIRCDETDMSQERLKAVGEVHSVWLTDNVELFLSPIGSAFEFYHIGITMFDKVDFQYYTENGGIQPDPYKPDFRHAVYIGDDFWSVELELPLTMFYMTEQNQWSDTWLCNFCRNRTMRLDGVGKWTDIAYTWCDMVSNFFEFEKLRPISGFPMRNAEDAVRIVSAFADITAQDETGYRGTMTVKVQNPVDQEFVFTSEFADTKTVQMAAGENEIAVPCVFANYGRQSVDLCLTRSSDGKVFKRYYPVFVEYVPIKLHLTKPEYRCNFYPGQDNTTVTGTVFAADTITMKLEGPGLATQVIAPNADGSFAFDTAGFEHGDAFLTVTAGEHQLVQKIRNLPPAERMMAWISGGNLVVNGKPTLRMDQYAKGFHTGERLMRRLDTQEFSMMTNLPGARGELDPRRMLAAIGLSDDITRDGSPREEVFREIDKVIAANKDRDFVAYYMIDEPECHGFSPVYVKYMYDYIAQQDPYHVVMTASRTAVNFINCYDWVEAHPYINPVVIDGKRSYGRSINTVGSYVHALAKLGRTDKCIGFMPTGYSTRYFNQYGVYPTFDEMICHIWAGMIPGGKTVCSYVCSDLDDRPCVREGTKFVFSSFETLQKYILFAKRTDLLKTLSVHAVRYDLDGESMFVVVNMTGEPQTVTVPGIEGQWHAFRSEQKIAGNTFELAPLQVIIGTTEVMDAGMSTYEQVKAQVDAEEHARTHSGNKLVDKQDEIEITTTNSAGTVFKHFYKMLDGMYGNYAWDYAGKDTKFVELNLTKVKPTFQKVVVHGFQVADATLMVRNNGELSTPELAEMTNDEWSTTFILKEPVCPDCLRVEFGAPRIEIYEIEAF